MSSAGLRRIGPGSPPPVVDDVAQFSFDRSGTQTQTVSSDFVQPLPVTVTPSYQLDGESTTPDELTRSLSDRERRSGVLTVTYEIANVTSQTTTVSFVDAPVHAALRSSRRLSRSQARSRSRCRRTLRGSTRPARRSRPARRVSEPAGR